MGCTFDYYSSTWNARSYVITLLVFAWAIPLIIIVNAYLRIIRYVKNSNIPNLPKKNMTCIKLGIQIPNLQMNDNDVLHTCGHNKCLPHVQQKVSLNILSSIFFNDKIKRCSNKYKWFLFFLASFRRKIGKNGFTPLGCVVFSMDSVCFHVYVDNVFQCKGYFTNHRIDSYDCL